MTNHIEKLVEATKNITVRYSLAYNEDGPDIGIRGHFDNPSKDSVIIDDIVWLIAGDIYEKDTHKRIRNINDITNPCCNSQTIYVRLRAQAIVYGKIVQVDLGKKFVYSISRNSYSDSSGTMELLDLV